MNYNVVSRPKLPRNKYGDVDNGTASGGTLYFSNNGSSSNSGEVGSVNINTFIGSTATQDGEKGLVPTPKCNVNEPLGSLNDNVKFLRGSGTWQDIPISRYTTENINKDGIDLDGNLTVTDTITTNTLNVIGAAHFFELVIDKVKAAGGNLLITPANFKVDFVGGNIDYTVDETLFPFTEYFYDENAGTGIYGLKELFTAADITTVRGKRLYQNASDTDNQITSEFEVGDMVRCKTLNINESTGDFSNKDYWTMILNTGTETFGGTTCIFIDVFYQFKTSLNETYGLGTKIDENGIVSNNRSLRSVSAGSNSVIRPISEERMISKDEVDTSEVSEVYIGSTTTIPSGTTLSADIITTNGTVYHKGDVLSTNLELEKGSVVILEDNSSNLDSLPNDTEFSTGESDTLIETESEENRDIVDDNNVSAVLLNEFTFGYGVFEPAVGDDIVSLGHLWNGTRQNAIIISAYDPMDPDLRAPAIAQYKGIRTFEILSKYRTTFTAANGNNFFGKFMVNYNGNYMDIDEKLNLFSTDITSGLEKVGIHLDGDNSTIKMVGSVEIKQNGIGETDTLTVWDDDNIMRVKISPEAIPNKSQIETNLNPTSVINFRNISGQDWPTSGEVHQYHTWTEFIWTWNHQWKYYLENAYFNYTSYVDIGSFNSGDKISLSELSTSIRSVAYFKGEDYVSTRSDYQHTQSISSVILRLKRKSGSSWVTVSSYNLTSGSTINVANESASISYPSGILSNYTIPTTASYRLELEIVYNVYASITYTEQQSNPYFMFDYSCNSNIKLVQPSASMTRVGRNGLVFNTDSAGQYFYAGNDGIEIKWGDSSITLDNTNGLKTNVGVTNITDSSSKYISRSASFVNCTALTSAATVYLPSTANYGVGRIITILCNDYVTISTYSSSENIYTKMNIETSNTGYPSIKTYPFNSSRTIVCTGTSYSAGDEYTSDVYTRTHEPLIRLMCNGAGWYRI